LIIEGLVNLPARTTAPAHAVFYFDFLDPESYLAAMRIAALSRGGAVSLTLEPVAAATVTVDGERSWSLLRGRAASLGVPFEPPPCYPFASAPLLETCLFVRDRSGQEAMAAVAERIWHGVWRDGADPSDRAMALRAAEGAAVPETALAAALDDPKWPEMLARVTQRARERGVRTVPALLVEDDLVSGLDGILRAEGRLRGTRERTEPSAALPDWTFGG
jgi:2-hydroxychromene-2-carboxylate isomerase